jgi:hypothetical protein
MKTGYLYALTAFCGLMLLACFLPWLSFKILAVGAEHVQFATSFLTLNGFHGQVTLFGLTLPNWLVVVATVAVGILAWLRASGAVASPPVVGIVLSVYCLAHFGILLVVGLGNPEQCRLGFGALVGIFAAAGMLITSILGKESNSFEGVGTQSVPAARF